MTKHIIVLTSAWLATIAAPAFAHDSPHAQECTTQGEKITDLSKRNIFLASCLKNIDIAPFVQLEKAEQCNQNAKNMKLEGQKQDEYLEHCYQEDYTHPERKQKPHPEM